MVHEGLGARVRVRLHGWAVAFELAGVMAGDGELKSDEGVLGAAACSLLLLSVLFSSLEQGC